MQQEPEKQAPETSTSERVVLGRYRLEERLGSGGMAEIYRAQDVELTRHVALKVLHPALASDPTFVERLRREAQAVAALSHPNVVTLYDYGEADGSPTLVMELVEGPNLAEVLRREGALSIEQALGVTDEVLSALEHAHARGIIHRDVKPQNILLAHQGQAKLADFGIAQVVASASITHSGEVLGSLHYLAPERLTGGPASPAADIYAVGVVLYQVLTGRLPFEGDLPSAIAMQHSERPAPPPSVLRPEIPPWLDQVILTALEKAPSARYPSARQMRQALHARRLWAHEAPTTSLGISPPISQSVSWRRPAVLPGRSWLLASGLGLAGGLALLSFALVLPGDTNSVESSPPVAAPIPPPATPTAVVVVPSSNPPTATATPPPAATPTPAPRPTLAEAQALIDERDTRGADGKRKRDTARNLADIEKRLEKGKTDEARKKADELVEDIRKWVDRGELEAALGEELVALLRAFASDL